MIIKLQNLKGKPKLKIHQNFGNFYDQMKHMRQSNIHTFEEDPFSKNA